MTPNDIKELCRSNGIKFIPHHECAICGEQVGWYLFGRWPLPSYEVAFDPSCGCGCEEAFPSDWEEVFAWVCDKNGKLRDEYDWIDGKGTR